MSEELQIKACLLLIEKRLGWGLSQKWANYDFEKLSVLIDDKTGILLSVTTLKRIWGRIKYGNTPTLTTLNTFAKFLDFEDWRTFTKSIEPDERPAPQYESEPRIEEKVKEGKKKRKMTIPVSLGLVFLLFSTALLIFSAKKGHDKYHIDSSKYKFKADKIISEGVPNTVVFTYDASAAETDSVFIVQTWDRARKTLVSKAKTKHSAIYYYPGFFRTKLIVDSTIVKHHDLQINSNGWLCLAGDGGVPLYFKKEEYQKTGRVEIDDEILKKNKLSLYPVPPKIRFFNQKNLGNLMNDNFTFETTLKNEFSGGTNACQYVEVLIQCKDDIIIIPLAAKVCTGKMRLYAAGKEVLSKEADLTGFGADLNKWTTLRVETKDKNMNFFVNNILAASLTFPHSPSGIVGVQYRFNGVGAVRNTWFENKTRRMAMD